jgi:serine protease Do
MLRATLLAACLILALPAAAQAQPTMSPSPAGFADLADRLSPAVVNIAVTQGEDATLDFPGGAPLERFNGARPGAATSSGSGFFIAANGTVVTNNHVVEGARAIEVLLSDGTRLPARLIGRDPATDLAVLGVEGRGRTFAFVRWGDSDRVRVGDWAMAIGNPFGLGGTVTVGIVSARNRDLQTGRFDDFLQTDAAINRGNSGGPLFNARGEVVGVNSAILSPTGASVGVGFAVPANLARQVVDQLVRTGSVARGFIGVRVQPLTPDLAAGMEAQTGALLASVASGGPAARAGLRAGDIVVRFDGKPVPDARSLSRFVAEARVGARAAVEAIRQGRPVRLTVTVEALADMAPSQAAVPTTPEAAAVLGLALRGLSGRDRAQARLPADAVGILVEGVDRFGPAGAQLRAGDVILEAGFAVVRSPAQLRAIVEAARSRNRPVVLRIWRNGDATYRAIRP